ncbi:MAG: hypothetical protein AAF709_00535 [Pseudomonadota bacterium]
MKERAWALYDDLYEHRARGRHDIIGDDRREVAKWIVFLHSDCEYVWPEYSFIQTEVTWLEEFLTFGLWKKHREQKWREFVQAGDFDRWPFVCSSDLTSAIANPRLFAGGNADKSS